MKRALVVLIVIFAFLGLSDSMYIARQEANTAPLLCNVENLSDCNIVAQSRYSYLFGVPLATYGIVFYSGIFILGALELALPYRPFRRALQAVSVVGVAISVYFTYVEIFVIRALCIYCLASALITLFILIAAGFIEPLRRGGDAASI